MKPRTYNPLDYASLSETLARELMASELMPLADVEKFYGDGFMPFSTAETFLPIPRCLILTLPTQAHSRYTLVRQNPRPSLATNSIQA